jgi:pimeloyl-ACP methyl ester carboxylesterase
VSDETPLLFGPRHDLVGVLTMPDVRPPAMLGCLMPNTGVLHRIGPHRLNVKLARILAQQGIASLRFDLSGLGDSPAPGQGVRGREQSVLDMQAAMDCLRATAGIERFLVVGVCSGAVNGYSLALADPRVVGLLMFDGFIYPTFKTRIIRRWLLFQALSWSAMIRRTPALMRRVFFGKPQRAAGLFDSDEATGSPPQAEFHRAMDSLAARGTSTCLIYSGSFLHDYNYHAQTHDAFRGAAFLEKMHYHFMPDVDHTLTALAAQRKLAGAVCTWAATLQTPSSGPL